MTENTREQPQPVTSGYTQLRLKISAPLGGALIPKVCVGCATPLGDQDVACKELVHRHTQSQSIAFDILLCGSCARGKRRPSEFFCAYPDGYDLVVQVANPAVAGAWKNMLTQQTQVQTAAMVEWIKQTESGSRGPEYDNLKRTASFTPHAQILSEERFTPNTPTWQPPANRTCFVVTATMGDVNHPAVRLLREFRDRRLLSVGTGRLMVRCYDRIGPTLAGVIAPSPLLRRVSYHVVVRPAVYFATFLNRCSVRRNGRRGRAAHS
jgi:hypothetical protein